MARKNRLLLVVLPLLIVIAACLLVPGIRSRVFGFFRGEPFFDGMPASAWAKELEHDNAKGKPAFDNLYKGGKAALPVLVALAFGSDSPSRAPAQALLADLGEPAVPALIQVLNKSSAQEQAQAAEILGKMGGKARTATEPLARLLDADSEPVRRAAMYALEKIGPQATEAIPDLVLIAEGKAQVTDPAWRAQAVRVLGQMGPAARDAVPALIACLKNADSHLAQAACQALAQLDKEALPAVPSLVEIVKDRQSPLRARAAFALGKIGPEARVAVPALTETLAEKEDAELRTRTKDALASMGSAAAPAVPALVMAFGREAPVAAIGSTAIPELVQLLRNAALQADAKYFLETFRAKATQGTVRVALLQTLKTEPKADLRQAAADLLGPSWGEPKDIVPVLIAALGDADGKVRQTTHEALVRFGTAAQIYLEQIVREPKSSHRLDAVQLLGRLGAKSQTSAPLLVEVLKGETDAPPAFRLAIVRSLAGMGYHPREALPILVEALKTGDSIMEMLPLIANHGRAAKQTDLIICPILLTAPDWTTRRQAGLALGRIGLTEEISLPAVKTALTDKHELVRAAAAEVLGGSGFTPDELAPLLAKLLDDPAPEVRRAAVMGLGKLGASARSSVPRIIKLAQAAENSADKKDPDLRVSCIAAFGGIGPAAKEAAPLLLAWLKSADAPKARQQIIDALGRIKAKDASKALEPLLVKDTSEGAAAALALWRIENSQAALAFLQEGLKSQAELAAYIKAIGQVGPAAHVAVPTLLDILSREKDLDQRALAAEALGGIGPNARPAIKALAESLRVPHAGVRIQAARALGRFEEDPAAAVAVPRLVDLLADPQSPQVRQAASEALWAIDPDTADSAGA
jgi:HEAT repeat protein